LLGRLTILGLLRRVLLLGLALRRLTVLGLALRRILLLGRLTVLGLLGRVLLLGRLTVCGLLGRVLLLGRLTVCLRLLGRLAICGLLHVWLRSVHLILHGTTKHVHSRCLIEGLSGLTVHTGGHGLLHLRLTIHSGLSHGLHRLLIELLLLRLLSDHKSTEHILCSLGVLGRFGYIRLPVTLEVEGTSLLSLVLDLEPFVLTTVGTQG
jgi:hypothetical protein